MGAESGMTFITLALRQLSDQSIELATSAANLQNDNYTITNVENYRLFSEW